jgi:transcriptional regulator with XRE-family HTH domain
MQTGRPSKRPRTPFGQRLLAAREAAGLSQAQVAAKLGMGQSGYAPWEREPVALRPEQIEQLAAALGVSAEQLLGKAAAKARSAAGPVGKVRRVFEQVGKLPRHHQDKVVEMIETILAGHQAKRGKAA